MHFKHNAEVVTSDASVAGRIDRVVVDPSTEQVSHIIVKKGWLFTQDKVIPVDHVDATVHDRVLLKKDAFSPEDYPDYKDTEYVPVGKSEDFREDRAADARRVLWYQTAVKMPFRETEEPYPSHKKPLFYKKKQKNIPKNAVALEEGATVKDIRGKDVGAIEDIYVDPDHFYVTHILIAKGMLSKTRKLIPVTWIKDIHEDAVRLFVEQDVIENLRQITPSEIEVADG